MVAAINTSDWLSLGLEAVGFSPQRQNICHKTNIERFRSHYGCTPKMIADVLVDIQTRIPVASRVGKRPDVTYFLMAFNFLRTYQQL